MTEAKKIASSLTGLLSNPLVKGILDRSSDIIPIINEVQNWWGYDLFTRKPSPAYDEYGIFKGTDLDLACFLYSLAGRGAVINIPQYKAQGPKTIKEGQVIKSQYNRNGKLINVGANKEFFSFNITIIDMNIVGEDKVGDFRTFILTDKNGDWYDGWKTIQFEPTLKENRFLTESKLWTSNKIIFKNFIHPNRWTSFFGSHYVITKMLIDRLVDQSAFLNTEIKRMLAAGVTFPGSEGPTSFEVTKEGGVSKKFTAFEAKIYIPETQIKGDYELYEELNQENLIKAYNQRKYLQHKVLPALRFMTRATEYAHFKAPDNMPAWLKNVSWEPGFKETTRARNQWDRLKLFQPAVGEKSVSIIKRTYEKSAIVSE